MNLSRNVRTRKEWTRPVDEVKFNTELFSFYQKLIKIRKENLVLMTGAIDFILVDNENKTLAYSRHNETSEVVTVFNTSDRTKKHYCKCSHERVIF